MDDKKAVHHEGPNIDVVKHHKDSLPSWDELKYFIRKYYLFLLIIALIPVVLFTLGQQLANRGSAAPRLQLNSGGKVGVQAGTFECRDKGMCRLTTSPYDCIPAGINKIGNICYNCYDVDKNQYTTDASLCKPSPTPVVCSGTGYSCDESGNCWSLESQLSSGKTYCENKLEPDKSKCGVSQCAIADPKGECKGDGFICGAGVYNVDDTKGHCYSINSKVNTDGNCLKRTEVPVGSCPNSCGQGSPAATNPPTNGGLSGCSTVQTDLGPGCWCSVGGWQHHYCTDWGKPTQYCGPQNCP